MTTTKLFQGLGDDAKNSSRVLAPPGGGSSFSFGGSSSISFGDQHGSSETAKPAPRNVAAPVHTPESKSGGNLKNKVSDFNPITGLPVYKKEMEDNVNPMKDEARVDPLTCGDDGEVTSATELESLPEHPAKPVPTIIKVKEPPGGRSSFSFF